MTKTKKEQVLGLFCLLLGIVILVLTKSFPAGAASGIQLTGPAFFPNVLAVILIIIGLYQIIFWKIQSKKYKEEKIEKEPIFDKIKKSINISVITIILMMIFLIVFLKILGFFTTVFIFLMVILLQFKIKPLKCLFTSIIFLVIIYIVFNKIFIISLPSGLLI